MREAGSPLASVSACGDGRVRLSGLALPPMAAADAFMLCREAMDASCAGTRADGAHVGERASFAGSELRMRVTLWDAGPAAEAGDGRATASVLDRALRSSGDSMQIRVSRAQGTAGFPVADAKTEGTEPNVEVELSRTGESFVAGVLDALPTLAGFAGPSTTHAAWGVRTAGVPVRVLPAAARADGADAAGANGNGPLAAAAAAAVEVRIGESTCNVHAALAAVLAAGAHGVRTQAQLPAPFVRRPARASIEQRAAASACELPASAKACAEALRQKLRCGRSGRVLCSPRASRSRESARPRRNLRVQARSFRLRKHALTLRLSPSIARARARTHA